MSLERACDVFGTTRGVKQYRVWVEELSGSDLGALSPALRAQVKDLCPRALKRLEDKIKSGTTPPTPRKAGEPEGDDDANARATT